MGCEDNQGNLPKTYTMIIGTKQKTYRKTSNAGLRTNFFVERICDFDDIYMDDVIYIRTSVLVDINDKKTHREYVRFGFYLVRTVSNSKLLLANNLTIKEKTLREILGDFGIVKE